MHSSQMTLGGLVLIAAVTKCFGRMIPFTTELVCWQEEHLTQTEFCFSNLVCLACLPSEWAICFAGVKVFDRSLLIWFFSFWSRDVAMATNFGSKIGEIDLLTFVRHTGIPKWIGISQNQWLYWLQWLFLYITYKFNELWSNNPRVYEGQKFKF